MVCMWKGFSKRSTRDPSSDAARRALVFPPEDLDVDMEAGRESTLRSKFGPPPSYEQLFDSLAHLLDGTWVGHYREFGERHSMTLNLALDPETGVFSGSGTDDLNPYTIKGFYNDDTGRAVFLKSYQGPRFTHGVEYRGHLSSTKDGAGLALNGTWLIVRAGYFVSDLSGSFVLRPRHQSSRPHKNPTKK